MIDLKNLRHDSAAFFLSAERSHMTDDENGDRMRELEASLVELLATRQIAAFWGVAGSYMGIPERSFMFVATGSAGHELATALCERYSQDSYLVAADRWGDGAGMGVLYYPDGRAPEVIGEPIITTIEHAKRFEAYSILDGFNVALVFKPQQ